MNNLQIVYREITDLAAYDKNTRTHSPEQIAQLTASIQEFGFTNPVLIDGKNNLIAGHGRVKAAPGAGLSAVPCIVLDHLSEAQQRALVIADNQIALNAGWDEELLAGELQSLQGGDFNLDILGFNSADLAAMFPPDPHADIDELKAIEDEATTPSIITDPETDAEYFDEMESSAAPLLPITPKYAEKHEAFIIVTDNQVDAAWLRNKLQLDTPRQSYKSTQFGETNIIDINQLKVLIDG